MSDDLKWMQLAYQLALEAGQKGEVPVGAVVVDAQNQLVGQGSNVVESTHNPCGHAEIIALQDAAARIKNHRLLNMTLYVTLEPCALCASALVQARIKRLVFATRDLKAGAAGSVFNLLRGYPLNHQVQIDEGILQPECAGLLTHFFQKRRTAS